MEAKELLAVFEKMYLLEAEIKEKITTRVQIVFTLILGVVTVSSYMLRMLDLDRYYWGVAAIVALLVFFFGCLGMSSKFAVMAFWGNTFKVMPSASDVKELHGELILYNEEVRLAEEDKDFRSVRVDVRAKIEQYLCDKYEECATHNSDVNIKRSRKVHESFRWLLGAFVPLGLAGSIFVVCDMDVSSPRKNFQVVDKYVGDQLGRIEKGLELLQERK